MASELVQAAIIAWLLLFGAIPWLATVTAALWVVTLVLQVRARVSARRGTE